MNNLTKMALSFTALLSLGSFEAISRGIDNKILTRKELSAKQEIAKRPAKQEAK